MRLIALDVDDTVLLPDKTISPRTARAIRGAAEHGCAIVLASARPIRSVLSYAKELGLKDGFCVGLNGAVIARLADMAIVKTDLLASDLVREVIDLSYQWQPDNCFLDFPDSFAARYDGEDVSMYSVMSEGPPRFIGDLRKLPWDDVCKIAWRVPESPFPVYRRLKEHFGDKVHYVVWEGDWSFIEFLHPETSKASALSWVTAHLKIPPSQVLAVGDQRNDREMLEWAGIGVAMGNAHPELKAVADDVTASVLEDGCALAIEKYVGVEPS